MLSPDSLDWAALGDDLDAHGFAVTDPLLDAGECAALAALFDDGRFRSTVDMARHRFGDGRYRYFDHPLPAPIGELREGFYRRLAPVANRWSERLGGAADAFPPEHEQLLERCRAAGQERPTPLILRYGEGDWNALHQDLYGDVYFPFQVVTVLTDEHRGRRARADGAAPARAEPRPRADPAARRVRDLPHAGAAERRQARLPPRRHAPRGEHDHRRQPHRARDHLSRRAVAAELAFEHPLPARQPGS